MPAHDAHRMVAKARMKRGFVVVEDLVDAKLVDHVCWPGCTKDARCQPGREARTA
jgi:hypothetical protein